MDESLVTRTRSVEHNGSAILNGTTCTHEEPTAKTKRSVRSNYQGIGEGEGASGQLNRATGNGGSDGESVCYRTGTFEGWDLRYATVVDQRALGICRYA